MLSETHIISENGTWHLVLATGHRVRVPEVLAINIQEMLGWEDRRYEQGMAERLRKINCHKVALYLVGIIGKTELESDPRLQKEGEFTFADKALALSDKEFVSVGSEPELRKLADTSCRTGMIYIGQIFNTELAHSFIVGKANDGKAFVCFDKAGFRENPDKGNKDFKFRVYEIGTLLKNEAYQQAKWRFAPFDLEK